MGVFLGDTGSATGLGEEAPWHWGMRETLRKRWASEDWLPFNFAEYQVTRGQADSWAEAGPSLYELNPAGDTDGSGRCAQR